MLRPPIPSASVAAWKDGTAGRGRARKETLTRMVPAGCSKVLGPDVLPFALLSPDSHPPLRQQEPHLFCRQRGTPAVS